MPTCRSCETELAEDANFCPNCGLRTEKGETDNVKTPVDRRPDWEKDLDYAIQNATKLLEEAVETAKKGLKQVSEEVSSEIDKAKEKRPKKRMPLYCPKCGHKNPNDSEYCTKCGAKINT
ncbi:MAG: zinc-ribbon domain-containing protein [Candidatus Thorarchaeota archaeon]